MSIPALLLFIFAPVLGLLVRVRVVAVLSALIVAASLSVAAPAEALHGIWYSNCKTDEWDDTPSCLAQFLHSVELNLGRSVDGHLRYFCNGTGTQKVSLLLRFDNGSFSSIPMSIAGFATAEGSWNSGGEFRLHKFQTRWDKESPVDGAFLQPSESDVNDYYSDKNQYYWQWGGSDWWGWKALEATPASSNPIRLLQTKSQLRIRANLFDRVPRNSNKPVVFTFPLAGAAEAIAKAKRGCGL